MKIFRDTAAGLKVRADAAHEGRLAHARPALEDNHTPAAPGGENLMKAIDEALRRIRTGKIMV